MKVPLWLLTITACTPPTTTSLPIPDPARQRYQAEIQALLPGSVKLGGQVGAVVGMTLGGAGGGASGGPLGAAFGAVAGGAKGTVVGSAAGGLVAGGLGTLKGAVKDLTNAPCTSDAMTMPPLLRKVGGWAPLGAAASAMRGFGFLPFSRALATYSMGTQVGGVLGDATGGAMSLLDPHAGKCNRPDNAPTLMQRVKKKVYDVGFRSSV